MGLSITVFEINGDFSRKWQLINIPTVVYLTLPLRGFTLELGKGAWASLGLKNYIISISIYFVQNAIIQAIAMTHEQDN